MNYVIFGLGNADAEYEGTRHNVGRMAVLHYWKKNEDFSDWAGSKKASGEVATMPGAKLLLYSGYMNNSGRAITGLVGSAKQAERAIVIYDDIDLPLGDIRISFDRGDGGHNGIKSVIKHLKTRKFVRVRIGVAPKTPTGKMRKPTGEEVVRKFLLSPFKADEQRELKKVFKRVAEALDCLRTEKREKCMSLHN